MKIYIDSREQKRLEFSPKDEHVTNVIVCKLDVGDYMVQFEDGFTPPIVFERKSMGDLFGTMGKGYTRFKKEIIRAQESNTTMFIAIEGDYSKVKKGIKHSKMPGMAIIRKLFTIWERYGVQPIFFKDRKEMKEYMLQFWIGLGKGHLRRKSLNGK